MSASTRRLLKHLAVGDEEQARVSRLLNVFLLFFLAGSLLITLAAALSYLFQPDSETIFTLLTGVVMALSFAGLLLLARGGYLRLASILLLVVTRVLLSLLIPDTA